MHKKIYMYYVRFILYIAHENKITLGKGENWSSINGKITKPIQIFIHEVKTWYDFLKTNYIRYLPELYLKKGMLFT